MARMGRRHATAIRMGAAERKFEAMVVDGADPTAAAEACGLPPVRALRVHDQVAARDVTGILSRPQPERISEQHAALLAFWMSQREQVRRDIAWASRKRDEADQGDPALDVVAAKWSREVAALRAELARAEERLRALAAMPTGHGGAAAGRLGGPA